MVVDGSTDTGPAMRARATHATPTDGRSVPTDGSPTTRISCPRMQISAIAQPARTVEADTVVVGIFEGEGSPQNAPAEVQALLSSGEARASFKSLALTHADGRRWLVVGLGARGELDAERARVAAATRPRTRDLRTHALLGDPSGHAGDLG